MPIMIRHTLTSTAPTMLYPSVFSCRIHTCQMYDRMMSRKRIDVAGPAFSSCSPRLMQICAPAPRNAVPTRSHQAVEEVEGFGQGKTESL